MNNGARVLYLTYDGLTDPLGQSQILPYLEGLAALKHKITIISCEKPSTFEKLRARVEARCSEAGIDWQPLRYRKRPPIISTAIDLAKMAQRASTVIARDRIQIVHCRSYLTALIGLHQKRRGIGFLFDMRGFWIDERFERGIWPKNWLFRGLASALRRSERRFFNEADAIISLTNAAVPRIAGICGDDLERRISVIPCCVDLKHFDPHAGVRKLEGRALLSLAPQVPLLVYVGSVGGAYPIEPVMKLFDNWSGGEPSARLLFITKHPIAEIMAHPLVQSDAHRIIIRSAEREEMPALLGAADAGVSFILASPCAVASSPTKLGEMLAMGLPVAANDGVGDTNIILQDSGAGVVVSDLSELSVGKGAAVLQQLPSSLSAPRSVAERWFSLERGVETYDRVYRSLIGK